MGGPRFHVHLVDGLRPGAAATTTATAAQLSAGRPHADGEEDGAVLPDALEVAAGAHNTQSPTLTCASVFAHLTLRCGLPGVVVSASSAQVDARNGTGCAKAIGGPGNEADVDGVAAVAAIHAAGSGAEKMLAAAVALLEGGTTSEALEQLLASDALPRVSPYPYFRTAFSAVERTVEVASRGGSPEALPYFDFIIATDVSAFDYLLDFYTAKDCAAALTHANVTSSAEHRVDTRRKPLGIFCILCSDVSRLCVLTQLLVEHLTRAKSTCVSTATAPPEPQGSGTPAASAAAGGTPEGGDALATSAAPAPTAFSAVGGGYIEDMWGDEAESHDAAVTVEEELTGRDRGTGLDPTAEMVQTDVSHTAASDNADESVAVDRATSVAAKEVWVAAACDTTVLAELVEETRWVDEVDSVVQQFQQLLAVEVLSCVF